MRTFNCIQMLSLLVAAPTLLSLCHGASFVGAGALFYAGCAGFAALFIWATILMRTALGD